MIDSEVIARTDGGLQVTSESIIYGYSPRITLASETRRMPMP